MQSLALHVSRVPGLISWRQRAATTLYGSCIEPRFITSQTWRQSARLEGLASRATSPGSLSEPSPAPKLSQQPKGPKQKLRLDELCLQQHPQYSRNVIQSWILQGKVFVDDKVITKAGHQVTTTSKIFINAEEPKYVCRAGLKLEKALAHFKVDVTDKVCLDSGQSTGGFTDCLLQNGAAKVSHAVHEHHICYSNL